MPVRTENAKKTSIEEMIRKVDRSSLKADFDFWPQLAKSAWSDTNNSDDLSDVQEVVFAGMGGSGVIGALLCDYANEIKSTRKFSCLNDYHLPSDLSKDALVIGLSSSGNTEETVSAVSEARTRGLTIVNFSSGGLLEKYSEKWGAKFFRTKMLKVPRSSLPGLFFSVLRFCRNSKLLRASDEDVEETIENLGAVRDSTLRYNLENKSLTVAKKIYSRTMFPIIYSQSRTRAVGMRFRQSLNENSKLHAFEGAVPEVCHNEVVGWDGPRRESTNSLAIFLQLLDDRPEIKVRFEILKEGIEKRGGVVLDSPYLGKSYLSRIISMLAYLDYSTFYLAVLRGVDPILMRSIDFLKEEMDRRLRYISRL
jgi:glucose/mannose-6-phosphate isomerase